MNISGREISAAQPPFTIAEMSCNALGSLERAFKIIEAAKKAGADCIKFQCYTADTITMNCSSPDFVLKDGPWKGRTLYDLYGEASTPWGWFPKLFEKAKELDIIAFSSVFDPTSVDFLETLNCPAYKIASMEITDTPLISYAAKTGKPLIISTGMASAIEISAAFKASSASRKLSTCFLHCISGYPSSVEEANLWRINALFGLDFLAGVSDHTLGIEIPIAATALGATIIEKHMTLSRSDGGPDAGFSLEPHEFKAMVNATRSIWKAMQPSEAKSEGPTRQVRRSLYAVKDIVQGEEFTNENVRSIRPGYGLPPKMLPEILGKKARVAIERGTALSVGLLA